MIELGQLERRHEDFDRRHARVIAVSLEGPADARQTQADYPHLLVLADEGRGLSGAVDLIHENANPHGGDASAPTTVLVDRGGTVRWVYRSPSVVVRLSPDDVLRAVDQHLP